MVHVVHTEYRTVVHLRSDKNTVDAVTYKVICNLNKSKICNYSELEQTIIRHYIYLNYNMKLSLQQIFEGYCKELPNCSYSMKHYK